MKNFLKILFLILLPAQIWAQPIHIYDSFEVREGNTLRILSGSTGFDLDKGISIEFWDRNEVEVDVKITPNFSPDWINEEFRNTFHLEVDRDGDIISLEPILDKSKREVSFWERFRLNRIGVTINYEVSGTIKMPAYLHLTISNPAHSIVSFLGSDSRPIRAYNFKTSRSLFVLDGLQGELQISGWRGDIKLVSCRNIHGISMRSSDIQIIDSFGSFELINPFGDISLQNHSGDVRLISRSGKVSAENHDGSIRVDAPFSDVVLTNVNGEADIRGRSGEINLSGIGGHVSVNSPFSEISLRRVNGIANINGRSGKIYISGTQGVMLESPFSAMEIRNISHSDNAYSTIKGRSGKIQISEFSGNLNIGSDFSDIDVFTHSGSLEITGRSGTYSISGLNGSLKIDAPFTKIIGSELRSQIVNIEGRSADIRLGFRDYPQDLRIIHQFGDINLSFPEIYTGSYNFSTSQGEIKGIIGNLNISSSGNIAYENPDSDKKMRISLRSGNIMFNVDDQE